MKTVLRFTTLTFLSLSLCSCFGLLFDAVGPKPVYNGPKPPAAVTASEVQSGHGSWMQRDPYELPASSQMSKSQLKFDSNGVPYGIESPYRDCVHSPYTPFPRLDITGRKSQETVYDPYTRRPFRIP